MLKKIGYSLTTFFMKKNKLVYYASAFGGLAVPRVFFEKRRERLLRNAIIYNSDEINFRVNYYNKLSLQKEPIGQQSIVMDDFKYGIKPSAYFFDTYKYLRYFPSECRFSYLFGDVTTVPSVPSFVKSRPIGNNNHNSIILKLDAARHFNFIHDPIPFRKKKNRLIGRSNVYQLHRELFLEKYFEHPLCDLGQVNSQGGGREQWVKPKMTLAEHLKYKFILCLEGNDVATNLKWVMSSNSVAVMPRPTYETWFMEGTLKPGVHYIEISPDYADVEEKLGYYIEHPGEAEQIIENAHQYVKKFQDKKKEKLISLLVLQKYFEKTGQLTPKA